MPKKNSQKFKRRHFSLHPVLDEKLDAIMKERDETASSVIADFVKKYKLKS